MNNAIISGDVIASTGLALEERLLLEQKLQELIKILTSYYKEDGLYGRLLKGDYIEIFIRNPQKALRIALIIKCYVKKINIKSSNRRSLYFREHGIRLAIGIGTLNIVDLEKGIIDGDAIYFAGRSLNNATTSNAEKIVIKSTLFLKTINPQWDEEFDPVLSLLDVIFSKFTVKQAEVIYWKLFGKSEEEIAQLLKKFQSTINQHSTTAGWVAIEKVIKRFEEKIQ